MVLSAMRYQNVLEQGHLLGLIVVLHSEEPCQNVMHKPNKIFLYFPSHSTIDTICGTTNFIAHIQYWETKVVSKLSYWRIDPGFPDL